MPNKTRSKIRPPFAVIFDMDGVIIDNTAYHLKSWQAFARRHSTRLTKKDFFRHLNGRVAADNIAWILGRKINKEEAKKFANEKETIYRKLYRSHRKLMPGLVRFLKSARSQGVARAVATSAPTVNVNFILGGLRARSYFTVIVDAAGVKHGKPHPEIFLRAARKLRVKPNRCIVFEDAMLGIKAAKRAKMKVVGVATSHSRKEVGHADLAIKDFKNLSLSKLQKLLEKS